MLAFQPEVGLLRKDKRRVLTVVVGRVVRSAQTILAERSRVNSVVRNAQQNGRLKLDIPIELRAGLRKAEAHHGARETVKVLTSCGRLKPVPGLIALAYAARKSHVAELDRLRSWLLRGSGRREQQNRQANEQVSHEISHRDEFQVLQARSPRRVPANLRG